jgi:single-strand DNA-binding protein
MNRIVLMGRLTADPDYRQTQSGISTCHFTVAVDRPQQKGKPKEADFINCQAWRSTADFIQKYFKKGKPIIVEGSMRNNNYTDKNGVQRYEMFALVDSVNFTISDNSQQQAQPQSQQSSPQYQQTAQQPQATEDVPF